MSRSVSIYSNKEFGSAWSELQFAKDYNKKVNREVGSVSIYSTTDDGFKMSNSPDSRLRYNKKTDPIIQDTASSTNSFKSSVKRIESAHGSSKIFIPADPKPQGTSKRNMEPPPSKSLYEVQKRQLKYSECNKANPNPITEGDTKSIYVQNKVRNEPTITHETKKQNETKFVLPSNRIGTSPRKELQVHYKENAKSIIESEGDTRFKEQHVAKKCNEVSHDSSLYGNKVFGKTYFGKKKSPFAF